MLDQGACRSAWYGEVYNPDERDSAVKTEMGSGQPADANLLYAAYVRNLTYYDLLWFGLEPEDGIRMTPHAPSCYSRSALAFGLPPWNNHFLLGGPGGRSPGCIWPTR
jgi:Neprosin